MLKDGIILQQKNYQRGITSKHHGDFYTLNQPHSFETENKCESHKKVCENKDFCNVIPSEDTKILEFNQYQKSYKAPFVFFFADLRSLIEKIDGCKIIQKIHTQRKQNNIFHQVF